MYDSFSSDYDRFVNWQNRLTFELPFIEAQLATAGGCGARVLDAACGTGMHTLALAQRGYQAAGADLSPGMIDRARANAAAAGLDVRFEAIGFGSLAQTFGGQSFDALLCLGNSLPHLLSLSDLDAALVDFAACLRPGGLLLVQNRNFDLVLAQRQRWLEPQSHREDGNEWVFLRAYDFDPDGLIGFHVITLQRCAGGDWQQRVDSSRLYPQTQSELLAALARAGFAQPASYGSLGGEAFDPVKSGNLVVSAKV